MRHGPQRGRGNLPAETSSLVGRRAELAAIKRIMRTARLVTLTGPGGVGKTRLALHVASSSRGALADGVWMVALAGLSQADLIPSTIMDAMDRLGPSRTDLDDLIELLGDMELLLFLDNCEHLAEACAPIASAILERCPNVRIIATSREALRIAGEAIFPVPPLSLPGEGERVASGSAVLFDAVALFKERASAVKPEFVLRAEDEPPVVELCRRLDGLPLAIELAAASMRWLPLDELAAGAENPLSLVTSQNRSSPDRHHTLRASLDYSYNLCTAEARALWAWLSVFRGGADLDAIRSVCGGPGRAIEPALAELVDKSLVTLRGDRYLMLETIRQYGEELLQDSDAVGAARRAHAEHFASMALDLEKHWAGPEQSKQLGWAKDNHPNIRAALEHCLEAPELLDTGLRMAAALWALWSVCNFESEGKMWLTRLISADAEQSGRPRSALAWALWAVGFLSCISGDVDVEAGLRALDRSIEMARAIGDAEVEANAVFSRGFADLMAGRIDTAVDYLERSIELELRVPGSNPYLALSLLTFGLALCFTDYRRNEAVPILERARSVLTAGSEEFLLSWSEIYLGLEALLADRTGEAVALLVNGLRRNMRGPVNNQGVMWAVEILGWTAFFGGDASRAARLMGGSERLSEEAGPHLAGFTTLRRLREDYLNQVRAALGPQLFEQEWAAGRELELEPLIAMAIEGRPTGVVKSEPSPVPVDLPLTPREWEIAERIAAGLTNRAIAAELVISKRTVDTHVENILLKLGFSSRTQIVALLASMGAASGKG